MYNSSGNSPARVHKNAFPLAAGPEATSYEKTAAVTLNLISYTIKSIICFPAQLAASCAPGNYFARARALTTPSVDQVAGAENREPLHFGGGSVKVRLFWNVRRRYEKGARGLSYFVGASSIEKLIKHAMRI